MPTDTKWIPGPWYVTGQLAVDGHDNDEPEIPWAICRTDAGFRDGVQEANAHLIAAAPELYSVLATAVMQGERILNGESPEDGEGFKGWFLLAKAALAKARGES